MAYLRAPPRPSSAPKFTYIGASEHARGKHRAWSACDKHRRKHNDQRNADVNVKQKLIDRITAKLPADWHGARPTLLETCKPPHLGSLNKNIKKDTPISICTFGIEKFERLGRGQMIVERDIQCRFKGKSFKYHVLKSQTDTIQAADNARRVFAALNEITQKYVVVDTSCL